MAKYVNVIIYLEEFVDCANTEVLALRYLSQFCLKHCHKSLTYDISFNDREKQPIYDTYKCSLQSGQNIWKCLHIADSQNIFYFLNLRDLGDNI